MISTKETIRELRNHLQENRLSVIIGAGFSKNASKKFLNWKELLRDMIVEMFGNKSKPSKKQIDQLVDSVISEKGYLSIASEYVKRHGYHEAIDHYIESRTPIVKKDNNEYSLLRDGKVMSDPVDLSSHELLLNLRWNNVYTFNYDNLLDIAADTDKYNKLEAEIIQCQEEILKLSKEKTSIDEDITNLDNEIADKQNLTDLSLADRESNGNLQETKYGKALFVETKKIPRKGLDNIEESRKKLLEKKIECENKNKTYKSRIDSLRGEQKDLHFLVDSAFKISLRKTKNIYKLHGNIRSNDADKYGFDQDTRCHYIISQQDYDNYREKHDAFVSLMRIALLQDYFCLIGFSGDDPNFLSWISWVKDIIDQRALYEKGENGSNNNAKIFFIDVSGIPLDRGKELFFKNHYIQHVPLLDEPGNEFVIKEKIDEFLKSLKNKKDKTIEAIEEYNLLWETDIYSQKKNDDDHVAGFNRSEIRSVWENRQYYRLPKFNLYTCMKRRQVIFSMQENIRKQIVDEDMAKLFMLAVEGELLPVGNIISAESIHKFAEQIKDYDDLLFVLQRCIQRNETLTGKYDIDDITETALDELIYESIIRMFFNLDFASAKRKIEKWNTKEIRWRVIKLILNVLLGKPHENGRPLTSDFDSLEYNNQELLYSLQIHKMAIRHLPNSKNQLKELEQVINEIKKPDSKELLFNDIDGNIQYLTRELAKQKQRISSYGDNRISTNLGGTDFPLIYSLQLLQSFIETGIPLSFHNVQHYQKESWYKAFKNIYELYPYPSLFYSLQYGNDKSYIQRIAQDYVYSNRLHSFCEDALIKMLRAYRMKETPANIKNAILYACPLFFSYIPNNIWQVDFEEIFNESDLSYRDENSPRVDPLYDFLTEGIQYSINKRFNRKVLYQILKRGDEIDNIDNNMLIAAKGVVTIKEQAKEVKRSIDNLISKAKSIASFYVLFNLQTILTEEQKSLFLEKLLKYDFKSCSDPTMIMASLEFGKNTILAEKVESEITENTMLWRNGIEKGDTGKYSRISQTYHLPLHAVQKYKSFSAQTIEKLYEKMKCSLDVIIKYHEQNKEDSYSEIINPGGVVLEMLIFLGNNRNILSKTSDFSDVSSKVKFIHNKISQFDSIMDALASNDAKIVNRGIVLLSYEVQYLGFKHFTTEYLIIANIILKRSDSGLSNSIGHFSDVIKNQYKEVHKMVFEPIIRKILDVYQPYFYDINASWDLDVKKELVEEAMIDLNDVVKKWGGGNPFWNNHQRLFNNDSQNN